MSGQAGEMRSRSNTGTPCVDEHLRLTQKRLERQHDAVADEAAHALAQDAGGDERKNGFLAADDERVTGVVAALKARHGARRARSAGRRSCPCPRRPTACRSR